MAKLVKNTFLINSFNTAFDFNWKSDFSFSGEAHDFWEVVYVASGAVEVTEDDRIYKLVEGNLLLHAPMEFHKIRSANNTSPHVLVMTFSCVGELPYELSQGVFSLDSKEMETYEKVFSKIYSFYNNDTACEKNGFEAALNLSAFLISIVNNHSAKEQLLLSRDAELYKNIINIMNKNAHNNINLESIAQELHISVSYMKVLFRRYAGIGPKQYFARLRCSKAIALLTEGSSAQETAYKLNFSSPCYFNVFFKRMTGLTPVEYIKTKSK